MDHSIFLPEILKRRFPVSLLAIEIYALAYKESPDEPSMLDSALEVLTQYCQVPKPSEEDIAYFIGRVAALNKPVKPFKESCRSFGTSYAQLISKTPIDIIILGMTNYNIAKAKHIYCTMDRDESTELIDSYIAEKLERNMMFMEACMYGFGGSYKNDKRASKDKGIDISSEEGEAALRALGF